MNAVLPLTVVPMSWRRWLKEPLFWGLLVSTLAHVLLLAIRFVPPPPLMIRPMDSQLEVVLLNAGNDVKPRSAEVVAQISMEAGGDRDTGRAKSPLPADDKVTVGQELREQARRQQELEQQQLQLLAQIKPGASANPAVVQRSPDPATDAPDPTDTRAVIAMLQAQISKDIDAYSKRPRRLTFGVNAIVGTGHYSRLCIRLDTGLLQGIIQSFYCQLYLFPGLKLTHSSLRMLRSGT